MNVSLTRELEEYVTEKVASGMYTSASEVVREGLRLLRERDELRRQIAVGLEQLDSGQRIPATDVVEEVRDRSHRRRTKA
jgi:antitoxin ParD1/3/4